jgi:hypothetical protein
MIDERRFEEVPHPHNPEVFSYIDRGGDNRATRRARESTRFKGHRGHRKVDGKTPHVTKGWR